MRVYDEAGNVLEMYEHIGHFKEPQRDFVGGSACAGQFY
jgi:hypothetical protein